MKKAKPTQEVNYNQMRIELGALATGLFYSSQSNRIEAFNRIRQIVFRKIEGKSLTERQPTRKMGKKEEPKKYKENCEKLTDKKVIEYITKNKAKLPKEEQEYIEQIAELLEEMRQKENNYKSLMKNFIEQEPIYDTWLKNIKGISTLNTANLLQYFGYCEKAKHCSSLWKYAGLHVVDGHSPKKEKGQDLDWNPKLRTLMYRIGDSFIKQRTPGYRDIYDREKAIQLKLGGYNREKNKMTNTEEPKAPKSLLHADLRARRKMVKMFLSHYYEHCRMLRGLPPEKPYAHRND